MRFYTKTHTHYCGIDLHAKTVEPSLPPHIVNGPLPAGKHILPGFQGLVGM